MYTYALPSECGLLSIAYCLSPIAYGPLSDSFLLLRRRGEGPVPVCLHADTEHKAKPHAY